MITQVRATSKKGNTMSFPLGDISQGYSIQNIEGLDPVKASITSSEYATVDGIKHQSSRREARDITVVIGLEADFTSSDVSGLRAKLYQLFMPQTYITLRFYDNLRGEVEISGMVEDFNCPLFTADPKATINILCENPDFVSTEKIVKVMNTVPFINSTLPFVDYKGDVPSGLIFKHTQHLDHPPFPSAGPPRPDIQLLYPGNPTQRMLYTGMNNGTLLKGETVEITTTPGSKKVMGSKAGGVLTSTLNKLDRSSAWFMLNTGVNQFKWSSSTYTLNFTVEYHNRYGGL